MSIEKTLVLSTSHVTEVTNNFLNETATKTETEDRALGLRHINHHYGWIIFLTNRVPSVEELETTPELRAVIEYAVKNECTMINFDRDAEPIDELETFEW